MPNELVSLSGTIEKIVYQNPENWYSVCDVCIDESKIVTAVGIMPYVSVGEGIETEGYWVTNKEYGKQFKVEIYKKTLPKQKNSILRYLSSGAIKGIGAKIAQKIVSQYGEDSFDVIANHPEWLIEINGISRKKAYDISNDFKEKIDIRELMTLSSGAISPNLAVKISKKWGRNALGIVKENPYILCNDVNGISFKKADEIAFGFGIASDNEFRIESGIKYVLKVYSSRDGHTYVKKDVLIDSVSKLLGIDKDNILRVLDRPINGIANILVKNEECVALNELYFAEISIAKKLSVINKYAMALGCDNLEFMISKVEALDGIKYASLQKKAIWEALNNGVTILTGGPGTGKTTVIKALLQIFSRLGLSCALCAPTGRAAKRMSESTQNEAKTVHRLLEVAPSDEFSDKGRFMRDNANPLEDDVIIVDETSMIDVSLMNSLLIAIKPGTRLILIGDVNQLPSVGEGNVLNDIIKSGAFATVCLNEIFRQSSNSGIVVNAHKINNGVYPSSTEKFDDFFFIQREERLIPSYIADLCKNRLPKKYGKEMKEGIQVITPTKKGACGTQNLNYVLQSELNPSDSIKFECSVGVDKVLRDGDRIMQMKNNYEAEWYCEDDYSAGHGLGVFNGDVGKILSINNTEQLATVDYSGKKVEYQFTSLDEIDLSYAITVHKSQGSEYPIVIIPVSSKMPQMLMTRNLLYTAITRAEKMVIIIGDINAFYRMIDNNLQFNRNTMLEELLRKEQNEI